MGDRARRTAREVAGRVSFSALAALMLFGSPPHAKGGDTPLDGALKQSSRIVERFWGQFPEVNCDESVLQTKLDKNGKIIYKQESLFDYLVLAEMGDEELGVTESRQLKQQVGKAKNAPLLVTTGFSMMLLVFHPFYQGSFEFSELPDELLDGKQMLRIQFQHVKGTRSPSALQLRGRNYPLDWKGTAWIDPDSWAIRRIEADLMEPMEDVGLQILRCDVRYGSVRFSTSPDTYWLPQVAEIEVETAHQHWRNVHRFSAFRRFSTDAKEQTKKLP